MISGISGRNSGILRILRGFKGLKYSNGFKRDFQEFRWISGISAISGFMDFGPDFRNFRSDLKGFRSYSWGFTSDFTDSRDFTSKFNVFKPEFRD